MSAATIVEDWATHGHLIAAGSDDVFVVDVAADHPSAAPPALVLHGFPTSSIDWREVLPALRAERRVVLLDMPGYGLSAKPDRPYSLFEQADAVEIVAGSLGLEEVDLVTHDMGDSVGGELLARSIDGSLGFGIRRRVLTNGSIYLDLAQLTAGQQLLAGLPDESLTADTAPDVDALVRALTDTMAPPECPESTPDDDVVRAAALLVAYEDGNCRLPRLIRYIEQRRQHETRWTGAIENHPAPLAVVWGVRDPIAVVAMTDRLAERRADAVVTRLDGVGHYPMVEAPGPFSAAVLQHL